MDRPRSPLSPRTPRTPAGKWSRPSPREPSPRKIPPWNPGGHPNRTPSPPLCKVVGWTRDARGPSSAFSCDHKDDGSWGPMLQSHKEIPRGWLNRAEIVEAAHAQSHSGPFGDGSSASPRREDPNAFENLSPKSREGHWRRPSANEWHEGVFDRRSLYVPNRHAKRDKMELEGHHASHGASAPKEGTATDATPRPNSAPMIRRDVPLKGAQCSPGSSTARRPQTAGARVGEMSACRPAKGVPPNVIFGTVPAGFGSIPENPTQPEPPVVYPSQMLQSQPQPAQQTFSQFFSMNNALSRMGIGSPACGPFEIPVRPTLKANAGKKTAVIANHFKCIRNPIGDIYQYSFDVQPRVERSMLQFVKHAWEDRVIGTVLQNTLLVFDGRSTIYTYSPLPFLQKTDEFICAIPAEGRRVQVKFTIKMQRRDKYAEGEGHEDASSSTSDINDVDSKLGCLSGQALVDYLGGRIPDHPVAYIQALDHTTKQENRLHDVQFGNNYFARDAQSFPVLRSVEMLTGFFKSLRATQQGLALNVDTTTALLHTQVPLLDYVKDFLNKDLRYGFSRADKEKVLTVVKGLVVISNHYPGKITKKHKIIGLSDLRTEELTFEGGGPAPVRVVDYFRKTYNKDIAFVKIPCVVLMAKITNYMPMELCTVVGKQRFRRALDEEKFKLCKKSLTKPNERIRRVTHMMENKYSVDEQGNCRGNKHMRAFNLSFEVKPTVVNARVLNAPGLQTSSAQIVQPSNEGLWSWSHHTNFWDPATIECWGVLNLCYKNFSEQRCATFVENLRRRLQDMGITIRETYQYLSGRQQEVSQAVKNIFTKVKGAMTTNERASNKQVQLIIVFVDERKRSPFYNEIKRTGDSILGVPTQVVAADVADNQKNSRLLNNYLTNLGLKINVKVGGRNIKLFDHSLSDLPSLHNRTWVAFGADVTHPDPGDDGPSLAAVVAGIDTVCARFGSRIRQQGHAQEIIEELGDMVAELLQDYKKANNEKLPELIVFFRDGVGESQFKAVLEKEMKAIKGAAAIVKSDYFPLVTLAVVQKRHHTRLFPGDNSGKNVLPGTIVDELICHPREFDFYLCSHQGIQGTSRPTHYHVLYDECKLSMDDFEQLTYRLCFVYQRCMRSVSMVAPAYYAHLVAFRARQLYAAAKAAARNQSVQDQGGFWRSTTDRILMPPIHDNLKDKMYFL